MSEQVTGVTVGSPPMGGIWALPRTRQQAEEADRTDPLAAYRDHFVFQPGEPIYLDGNSLGRQPRGAPSAVASCLKDWGELLVSGWDSWADLPRVVGDGIGRLIGAAPGQVVVSDSTSVNLYKLAVAALDARPGREVVVGDANDFPTVRYVLQGLAAREGRRLQLVGGPPEEPIDARALEGLISHDVALVCFSAVNYRSGAVADMPAVNQVAQECGALVLWDLSHAAGAVPLALDEDHADLAVGCGYKYLNGGPGAPAFLYVSSRVVAELHQPIWGWWGQAEQFEMGERYQPVAGVGSFLVGTPAVLGAVALGAGIGPLLAAGTQALWEKSRRLVALTAERAEARLLPLGARIASPADPTRRGAHLALSHLHARAAVHQLIEKRLVVPDFRPPDIIRLAPVPIYTRYVDVWDAVERVASVLDSTELETRSPFPPGRY